MQISYTGEVKMLTETEAKVSFVRFHVVTEAPKTSFQLCARNVQFRSLIGSREHQANNTECTR